MQWRAGSMGRRIMYRVGRADARQDLLCSVGRVDGRDSIVGTRRLGRRGQKLRFVEQWGRSSAFADPNSSRSLPFIPAASLTLVPNVQLY